MTSSAHTLLKMKAPTAIQEALEPLLEEGVMPGVSVWRASFSPFEKTSECEAFRLHGWDETKVQIGTSEAIKFETRIPGSRYEEDGVVYDEPETIKEHSFRFLALEPLDSRDMSTAALHEVAIGSMEGIDLLYASYEIPFPAGKETRRVVGGLRVRLKEGYYGPHEASFAIIQKRADERIYIGPASQIIGDLPSHFEEISP